MIELILELKDMDVRTYRSLLTAYKKKDSLGFVRALYEYLRGNMDNVSADSVQRKHKAASCNGGVTLDEIIDFNTKIKTVNDLERKWR